MLKERFNIFGQSGCAIALLGSTVIVINSPKEDEFGTLEELAWRLCSILSIFYIILNLFTGLILLPLMFRLIGKHSRSHINYRNMGNWRSLVRPILATGTFGSMAVIALKGMAIPIKNLVTGKGQLSAITSNALFWIFLFVFIVFTGFQLYYWNAALDVTNLHIAVAINYCYSSLWVVIGSLSIFNQSYYISSILNVIGFLIGLVVTQLGIMQMTTFGQLNFTVKQFWEAMDKKSNHNDDTPRVGVLLEPLEKRDDLHDKSFVTCSDEMTHS